MFTDYDLKAISKWATEVLAANDLESNADMLDMLGVYTQEEKQQLWAWLTVNDPLLKLRLINAKQSLPKAG